MDDLQFYIQELDKALNKLNNGRQKPISSLEFQMALCEVLGYEDDDAGKMLTHRLNADQMLENLSGYDFPEKLAFIEFEVSIIPENLPSRLDEQIVKVKGEIWEIHKYDKDPCPSNPHAHNIETGYKLHLGTGELYSSKCKPLFERVKEKDLRTIRSQISGIKLPRLKYKKP